MKLGKWFGMSQIGGSRSRDSYLDLENNKDERFRSSAHDELGLRKPVGTLIRIGTGKSKRFDDDANLYGMELQQSTKSDEK